MKTIFLNLLVFLCIYNYNGERTTINQELSAVSIPLRFLTEEVLQEQVDYFYRHMIAITIGSPPQKLRVKLTTSFCGLWIQNINFSKQGFNSSDSTTFISSNIQGEMEYVTGTIVKDTVIFIEITVPDFPFLLVDSNKSKYQYDDHQGIIGFGYHCNKDNKATTDVLNLFNNNSSFNLYLFWFRLNINDGRGWFKIGALPNDLETHSKYHKKVPVDIYNKSGQWKIMLDSIYFNDGELMIIEDKISIGIGGAILSVNYDVFVRVANKYFKKLLAENQCEMNEENILEIVCNTEIQIPNIGYISFVVGKWNFKVDAKKLFINISRDNKRVLWFALVHYPQYNEFYISQLFLSGIHIIYDKSRNEIGFYDNSTFTEQNN